MRYQSQESMRLVALGLVSIAAISMGAASIDSMTGGAAAAGPGVSLPPVEGPTGTLNVSGPEINASIPVVGGTPSVGLVANLSSCVEPLAAWYGGLLYFGAFGGVLYLVKRRFSLGGAVLGMYALSPVAFSAYFLSTDCAASITGPGPDGPNPPGPLGPEGPGLISPDVPPVLIAAVLGVALVGIAAVLYRATGDQSAEVAAPGDQGDLDQADVADLAAAAGKAADRLEKHNADVDNAVYQAWWEMTSLLQVPDPQTSTPGEFADAAVALGMAAADVEELTRLFEEVRYGKRDPESREQLALDVFRSIEAEYGEHDPDEE